jgi:hypothetical protein
VRNNDGTIIKELEQKAVNMVNRMSSNILPLHFQKGDELVINFKITLDHHAANLLKYELKDKEIQREEFYIEVKRGGCGCQ